MPETNQKPMYGYIDDKNFALVDFIKNHKDDWEEILSHRPYSLKQIRPCTWHPNWYMFVYNLSRSLLTDPVVRNCRGVALEIDGGATIHFNRDNGCFYLTGGWTD